MENILAQSIVEDPRIVTPKAAISSGFSAGAANLATPVHFTKPTSFLHLSPAAFSAVKISTLYLVLFLAPISLAVGINQAAGGHLVADSSLTSPVASLATVANTANSMNSAIASDSTAQADTSSVAAANPADVASQAQATAARTAGVAPTSGNTNQDFAYEVALANGFLKKAIDLSNSTADQTVEDKNTIVQLLTQALDAANRAIQMNPNNPEGYTSRGRVYQATSIVKPEMKTLADQDFAKAGSLGSSNPTQAPPAQNPVDLLPTEQASKKSTAMIAGPNDKQQTTVDGQTQQNAHRGTTTLAAGKTEVFVPYTAVQDTTQLYVTADKNPENLTFYVKNKEGGVGFTIAATAAPTAPVDITWWEIQ